jgi:hypothetical protein
VIDEQRLRPLERRIRRLNREGIPDTEIGRRFRRSPDFVRRVMALSELEGRGARSAAAPALRPLERRVLRWRDEGADAAEIAPRFHRSPEFIQRVEGFARHKLSR